MGGHCDNVGEPNEGRHEETMLTYDQLDHAKKGAIRKRQGGLDKHLVKSTISSCDEIIIRKGVGVPHEFTVVKGLSVCRI